MANGNSSTILFQCNNNQDIANYIKNLTSSYTDKSNESTVVASSVAMFVLAAVFFNLNLFSRVSDMSAVLNPTARLVLSTSLSLFLPVMSYLFSEAKNSGQRAGPNVRGKSSDLPLRARMILTWMLLVELLRKKVEAILVKAGVPGSSSSSSVVGHVTSVVWLGYLVFFNLKGAGRKAVFGILWVLCAAKLLQRIAVTELGKRSLAYGKNARLLSSYMAQMLREAREKGELQLQQPVHGSARLTACKYVVMGEEEMVQEAGPHGYKLDLDKIAGADSGVVTVGKIWMQLDGDKEWAKNNHRQHLARSIPRLKRLSLSFALFKLLRRRLEPLPAVVPAMSKEETDDCRRLIFDGLCKEEEGEAGGAADPEPAAAAAVALFQVITDEVNFLTEYYNSVLPVMFASPYFFLVYYLAVPVVVLFLCAMTVVLCSNGNLSFSIHSIRQDNYALSSGILTLTKCLWQNVLHKSPQAFFATVDVSISYLLFLAFIYEEVWEFIIFMLSNWFSVSLLCNYTAKSTWRSSTSITGALRRITWVRSKLSDTRLIVCKQFSVLAFCWLSTTLPSTPLPKQAKRSIMERLMAYGDDGGRAYPLSNGRSALVLASTPIASSADSQGPPPPTATALLSRFCESESVAEVIATWHIATSLLETKSQLKKEDDPAGHKIVATTLSKYCAYLLAFHPELLPDDQEGTTRVYKGMKADLKDALGGTWGYYFMSRRGRCNKLMMSAERLRESADMTVVGKGVVLGKELVDLRSKEGQGQEHVWELLARFWVELVVYIAPSGSEEHDKGHEVTLVQGGELITLLWALTTHTGITRPSPVENNIISVEERGNTCILASSS